MSRIESLSVLLENNGHEYLSEKYGTIIRNVQANTFANSLKNNSLSGDINAGSVEAKRLANPLSEPYGTARSLGSAKFTKVRAVTVALDRDRELLEEIEEKDVNLYGVDSVISRKISLQGLALSREIERSFFKCAADAATTFAPESNEISEQLEEIIVKLETSQSLFADGVPRDLISVGLPPAVFSRLRLHLDNLNGTGSAEQMFVSFHGVRVYSSPYLPAGVKMLAMCDESVALPIRTDVYQPKRVDLSNSVAFGLFFSYGVAPVMPELILKMV